MPPDLETSLAFAVTTVAVTWSAVVDMRTRRIPNLVTFPAMAALLAIHGVLSGLPGLTESFLGLAGGFLVFLVPHLFRLLGAGDVKLMAAVGAGLGSRSLVTVVLLTSLAGGVQILPWLLWRRLSRSGSAPNWRPCYGPAIAAGAVGAMALQLFGAPYLSLPDLRF